MALAIIVSFFALANSLSVVEFVFCVCVCGFPDCA